MATGSSTMCPMTEDEALAAAQEYVDQRLPGRIVTGVVTSEFIDYVAQLSDPVDDDPGILVQKSTGIAYLISAADLEHLESGLP